MAEKNKFLQIILNQSLDQVMSDRFSSYSKYIIQERALPDARDGLKPVQRRILFSMSELGLTSNKPFKKSARVVGDVIGKYHPHGDSSIYEAMVRMSQDWKMNVPLIEMHGNNGSIDDDPAAAMRYTEARMAKVTNSLLNNIKKDTVLFAPNFDDSEKEPTVLPGLFPNLLTNGVKGIAAGYATEMPPHNLGEIIDAIIAKIKSPNIRMSTLLEIVKGPDFPTGGIVQGQDGIKKALETGKGKVIIRSKYDLEQKGKIKSILISEIPYGVVKSKLVREIDEIRFNNKIDGISEVRDESDRNGIAVRIELDNDANVQSVIDYLLVKTSMQVHYNYNSIAIKDKVPTQMTLNDLLSSYLDHQVEVQRKAIQFDLKKDKNRLEIVLGLIKVAQIPDEVIRVIRNATGSKAGVVEALMNAFQFTKVQATAIADLRLYRLSRADQAEYIKEKEELESRITRYELLLNDGDEFNRYLIEILRTLKKEFAVERRTVIESEIENISINMEKLVKQEEVWVGVSKDGYLKKFSNRAKESNTIDKYGLKDGDSIQYLNKVLTTDKLLIFITSGKYYSIPVHKITEFKFREVGMHLNDFATMTPMDTVVEVLQVRDFDNDAMVTLATSAGKGKRVKISDFSTSVVNRNFVGIKVAKGDSLVGVQVSNGSKTFVGITNDGKAVKYLESAISTQGTKSAGIKLINLSDNKLTAIVLADENGVVGLASQRGGFKRIKVSSLVPMSRNTQGRPIASMLKNNAHVVVSASEVKPGILSYMFSDKIESIDFKDVPITTANEGFTSTNLKMLNNNKIYNNIEISSANETLVKAEELTEEEIFDKAEKKLAKDLDQLSFLDVDFDSIESDDEDEE